MARRLPLKANLSMGGASRGASAGKSTRAAKAKPKFKAKKSRARRSAEHEVEFSQMRRKSTRRSKPGSPVGKTRLARSVEKQRKEYRQKARAAASRARKPGADNVRKQYAKSSRDHYNDMADRTTKAKTESRRNVSSSYKTGADRSRTQQDSGKRLIEARKALARTPRQGGKYRVGTKPSAGGGRRTHFLDDAPK